MSEVEISDIAAWCKAQAKKGADQLHARATANDARAPKLTDAESAAIARAKIDRSHQ
jgi:hypothetical protein